MEKNMKKAFVISVLGMFMFIFAVSFVSAANPIGDWFTNWEDADMSPNVAKYLLWALVSMVVYSVGSKIPGLSGMFTGGKEGLGMIFSAIVGFLSMAYITPDEVYALMISYSALGFVVGGAIPFLILIAFTFTLGTDETGGAKQMLANKAVAWVMWVGFFGFIVYKTFLGIGETTNWAMWTLLVAIIMMIANLGYVFKKFRTSRKEAVIAAATEKQDLATAHVQAGARAEETLGK